MKLTSESKLFLAVFGITALIIALAVIIMSRPAKPLPQSELILSTTPVRGNPNASVWLVEFSDFQCPACKVFAQVVDELANKYPDKLFVAYRFFPLNQHPYSKLTARAAQLAGKENFWEMGKILIDNQEAIATSSSQNQARETIINLAQLISSSPLSDSYALNLSGEQGNDIINADLQYGSKIGINATPTFYLNGVKLELANVADLKTKVEEAINKK